MSTTMAVSATDPSELGAEIVRRLRLKAKEPVLIVEGDDFVLIKRAPIENPLERFDAITAKAAARFQELNVTPKDVDDAVRWARGSS